MPTLAIPIYILWKTLLQTVMAPDLAITAAEPSGLWGLLQESFASGTMLAKARMDTTSNPLIKAVVEDFATSEGRTLARDGLTEHLSGKKPSEVKNACIDILGKVDGILNAKAPGDAAAFKNWLRDISQNVAEASTEGGFFGSVALRLAIPRGQRLRKSPAHLTYQLNWVRPQVLGSEDRRLVDHPGPSRHLAALSSFSGTPYAGSREIG
jgi:hypothetical protein